MYGVQRGMPASGAESSLGLRQLAVSGVPALESGACSLKIETEWLARNVGALARIGQTVA